MFTSQTFKTLVQQKLLSSTFAEIASLHGVYASRSKCGRFVSYNYDQLEARTNDPLATECRGLILAKPDGSQFPATDDVVVGETIICAHPMDRFLNHGQGTDNPVNMDSQDTRFMEKLDGTCSIVWWNPFDKVWCMGTRSVSMADQPIDGYAAHTFRTLFDRALFDTCELTLNGGLDNHLDKHCTYVFELTSPMNRIVVEYKDYRVTLLAVRNILTNMEVDPMIFRGGFPVPVVRSFRFGNVQEMLDYVQSQSPRDMEGVVVWDGKNRCKVKSAAYVAYSKLRDAAASSPRGLLTIILSGTHDDVFPMLPDYLREHGENLVQGYVDLCHKVDADYDRLMVEVVGKDTTGNPRKALALAVTAGKHWMAPVMARYQGRCSNLRAFVDNAKDPAFGWSNQFLDGLIDRINAVA